MIVPDVVIGVSTSCVNIPIDSLPAVVAATLIIPVLAFSIEDLSVAYIPAETVPFTLIVPAFVNVPLEVPIAIELFPPFIVIVPPAAFVALTSPTPLSLLFPIPKLLL